MAINFTDTPVTGNTYTGPNGITYTYDANHWQSDTIDSSTVFVLKAGDSMTGTLFMGLNKVSNVADPVAAQDAATKNYVDTTFSTFTMNLNIAGDTGTDSLTANTDTLTVNGTPNEIVTVVTNNKVTIGLPDDVTITANLTIGKDVSVAGNTILGDAATDIVTFNAKNVSAPNDLNFDSGTLYIDSTNNRVGVGITAPKGALDVTGAHLGNVNALAGTTIDCSLGNYFTKTITGATTFTITNAQAGRTQLVVLKLVDAGTNITWPASVKWPSGTAPTFTTTGTDIVVMLTDDGGANWYAKISMRDVK